MMETEKGMFGSDSELWNYLVGQGDYLSGMATTRSAMIAQ